MDTKTMPYIGITGFTKKEEVEELIKEIPENFSRKLMVGVLVSHKRMDLPISIRRFAATKDIKDIFLNDSRVINMIHYCNLDKENILEDLEKLVEVGGKNLHGFQLNMQWPALQIVRAFKEKHPDQKIVLQMKRNDFDMLPQYMADCLSLYNDFVEYVILDMSMGAGIQMDPKKLGQYAREIQKISNVHIVFAGGLRAENLDILKPLVKEFPNMCIDAEGQLMNDWDKLDIKKCQKYFQNTIRIFS